jgi:hypothetical protein
MIGKRRRLLINWQLFKSQGAFMNRILLRNSIAALATTLIAGTSVCFAADVEKTVVQKDGWASYAKQLAVSVERVNKACGSTLSASYDKSTYPEFDPIKDRTQSACQAGVDALAAVCASDAGKSAVKQLKRASCRFSTQGTGVASEAGTLMINIDPAKSTITGKQPGGYTWASAIKEIM